MNIIDKPHASPESEAVAAQEKEKLQLRRITRALGATWRIPLAATIVLVVLAIAALVALRAIFPPTRVYLSQFHFTFPSAESGRYPNNNAFNINEILDPAILDVVYDQLGLGKYDVDRNEFYGSFSIRPFVLAESEIAERFRKLRSLRTPTPRFGRSAPIRRAAIRSLRTSPTRPKRPTSSTWPVGRIRPWAASKSRARSGWDCR